MNSKSAAQAQQAPPAALVLITVDAYFYIIPGNLLPNIPLSGMQQPYTFQVKTPISYETLTSIAAPTENVPFKVDQYYQWDSRGVVRISQELIDFLLSASVSGANPAVGISIPTTATAKATVMTTKAHILDGRLVVPVIEQPPAPFKMFICWNGDKFVANKSKQNDDDICTEGTLIDGTFDCKYGKFAV